VRLGELQTALQGLKVPLVVFHDPDDDVVPFVGSSDLSGIAEVVECPGGGHRLLPVLEDGRIADGIRRVAAKGER
jgi:hypothetical protein